MTMPPGMLARGPGVGRSFAVLSVMILVTVSCGSAEEKETVPVSAPDTTDSVAVAPAPEGLKPVRLPDLSVMTESVQDQIRQRYSALVSKIDNSSATRSALGDSYGELGMILMAADQHDVAEVCLLNAQALVPTEVRWPYYLGHLYKDAGELTQSLAAFEQAQELQPDYMATLVYLGDTYLEQGHADRSEPLFARALSLSPDSLSARFGLGRTALMNEDYDQAVEYLEEILTRNAEAVAAHYPLGIAYRGLGELEKAEQHLLLREDESIRPADPLMVALDGLLESPQAYERRGIEALDLGDWDAAETHFREGLELDPTNAALRHRLGTTLYVKGDERGALTAFEEVVRSSPDYPPAQYSLGVLYQTYGRHTEAIERFTTALEHRPTYTDARQMLANSLRHAGDAAASLAHYEQVLEMAPGIINARFGRAMAYVQLHRYQEARDHLSREMEAYPDEPSFSHALVRVLAAAPDDRVRNGPRAMELIQPLLEGERSLDLGETMAMTLAEIGEFEQAAAVQQDLIGVAQRSGLDHLLGPLTANLTLYESGQPCRTPWRPGAVP